MTNSRRQFFRRAAHLSLLFAAFGLAGCASTGPRSPSAQLTVMVSGAFQHTFEDIVPRYERHSGVDIVVIRGPSMGDSPTAIPRRLERGEKADIVILARESLDRLVAGGHVSAESRTDLVLSKIAMAVKKDTPAPDISTTDALRDTLLGARSVAYSDSASGVYIAGTLFPKLDLVDQMQGKARKIEATPVGLVVARGEAEIGFQQLSELIPIKGILIVGLLPQDVQKATRFSGGIAIRSTNREEAQKLLDYLRSDSARGIAIRNGLEPIAN